MKNNLQAGIPYRGRYGGRCDNHTPIGYTYANIRCIHTVTATSLHQYWCGLTVMGHGGVNSSPYRRKGRRTV